MSGGGEKATYRLSLGYMSDDGTTIGTSLKRLNTSLNVTYQFSNKLKFGALTCTCMPSDYDVVHALWGDR